MFSNSTMTVQDIYPLEIAVKTDDAALVNLLLQHGAKTKY